MPDNLDVLNEWERRIVNRNRAHSRAGAHYDSRNKYFGMSSAALSTIVGTAVFATLESSPDTIIKIFVGLLSICAAVFSVLHTKFNWSALAQKHNDVAKKYGVLRRTIERIKIADMSNEKLNEELIALDSKWDEISENALTVPQKIWDKATQGNKSKEV